MVEKIGRLANKRFNDSERCRLLVRSHVGEQIRVDVADHPIDEIADRCRNPQARRCDTKPRPR